MMWRKADLFSDTASARRILAADSPSRAKALGRQVQGYDEDAWVSARWQAVVEASVGKFAGDRGLLAYLLGTAPQVLVEASPVDAVWGIGLAADDARARDPRSWRGQNLWDSP